VRARLQLRQVSGISCDRRLAIEPATPRACTHRAGIKTARSGNVAEILINIIGYRPDCDVPREIRVVLKSVFVGAVIVFAALLLYLAHRAPIPTRGNVAVLARLDAFTKHAAPDEGNTIPAFLALPGRTGRLGPDGDVSDPVTSLDETELGQAFCSSSIADLVRHEYPGYYDRWSDERLERLVVEKHPEYANRYCMLSSRLDASANEVIKYELKRRSALAWAGVWVGTLLLTGLFAIACVNAYYRLLVGRFHTSPRAALAA